MSKYVLPIVGARHRPPAPALLLSLPIGASLMLKPEPDNPYDENAIQVIVGIDVLEEHKDELEQNLEGYGFTLAEILSELSWHLGYIPKTEAVWLAPKLDNVPHEAKLSATAQGGPAVAFEL